MELVVWFFLYPLPPHDYYFADAVAPSPILKSYSLVSDFIRQFLTKCNHFAFDTWQAKTEDTVVLTGYFLTLFMQLAFNGNHIGEQIKNIYQDYSNTVHFQYKNFFVLYHTTRHWWVQITFEYYQMFISVYVVGGHFRSP